MPGTENSIILLDGGMGQELRRRSTQPASPLWSAQVMSDEADLVRQVHQDYIKAGARVITLNAYSITPKRLENFGDPGTFESLQAGAIEAARGARRSLEGENEVEVAIAGCLPPLVGSYVPELAPEMEQCLTDYRRIVACQAPHVDLLLCETMSCEREAVAATRAGAESGKPVWTALTVDDGDGTKLRSGESVGEVADAVIAAGAQAVLVNCSSPEAVAQAIAHLRNAGVPFGAYANGFTTIAPLRPGGTVDVLESRTDLEPAAYADHAMNWIAAGASIVGGCCEVGPDHIAKLHERLVADGRTLASSLS